MTSSAKTLRALQFCKYCGAQLKADQVGKYCPTRNCQWQHGVTDAAAALKRKRTGRR